MTYTTNSVASGSYTNILLSNLLATRLSLLANGSCTSVVSATIAPAGRTIVYSVTPPALGCTINASTGELSPKNATATTGTVTVRAADSVLSSC
jgi:hypothetical protein